jgi:anti-sigma factor RsiW
MTCFDTERLSMHLDGELEPQAEREVVVHLHTCQRCAANLRALQESEASRTSALARARSVLPVGPTCYRAEELSAYASGLLTPQEAQPLEQHLFACDACLREVMAIRRTQTLLHPDSLITPPPHLVAAAQRASASAHPRPAVERLGTIIVRLVRDGLEFVEAALLPEHARLTVGGHLIPAGAFRSPQGDAAAAALLDLQQTVGDLALRIQVLHEDQQSVLLRLQVHKQGSPWGRLRVSLLSGGRTLGARQTSERGEVEFPRLPPGDYVIRLARENIETQLILRT